MNGLWGICRVGCTSTTNFTRITLFKKVFCLVSLPQLSANGYVNMYLRHVRRMEKNYPPCTIRQLLAAFQHQLRSNKLPFNLFDKLDLQFADFHNTLAIVCVNLRKEGRNWCRSSTCSCCLNGTRKSSAELSALGVDTPESLLRAVFLYYWSTLLPT